MEEQNIAINNNNKNKIIIIVAAIALLLIASITLLIVFSPPIPKDYKKLRQNLRDDDYTVVSSTNREEILDALNSLILEDIFYYEDEGLEEELYSLIKKSALNEHEFNELSKSIDCLVFGYDEDIEDFIVALYFEDRISAKEFYSLFKPLLEFVKKNGSDGEMFENIKRNDFRFGQKGKLIYIATKDAVKSSK